MRYFKNPHLLEGWFANATWIGLWVLIQSSQRRSYIYTWRLAAKLLAGSLSIHYIEKVNSFEKYIIPNQSLSYPKQSWKDSSTTGEDISDHNFQNTGTNSINNSNIITIITIRSTGCHLSLSSPWKLDYRFKKKRVSQSLFHTLVPLSSIALW